MAKYIRLKLVSSSVNTNDPNQNNSNIRHVEKQECNLVWVSLMLKRKMSILINKVKCV